MWAQEWLWLALKKVLAGLPVFASLLLGCGGNPLEGVKEPQRPALTVESSAVESGRWIPSQYRCVDETVWLPLEWSKVPQGTQEIIVVRSVSRFQQSKGGKPAVIGVEVLAGMNPRQRGLRIGEKPIGSYVKRHASQFCPSRARVSGIVFVVYAMPFRQNLQSSKLRQLEASALAAGSLNVLYGGRRGK